MKTQSIFVIACCLLAVTTSFAQDNTSSKQKVKYPPAWLLRGNRGIDTAINFIGTKDAQPLIFKVNNQKAGYLDYSDYNLNTAFGYLTLNANIVSDSGGRFTSAFGAGALSSNTTGWGNTAHGTGALFSNTTGSINTAVGGEVLISNTTGAFNTAIGYNALYSDEIGSFNTATGDYALFSNTTGSGNIANGTPFTLSSNTEGWFNIATGPFAMNNNTTGNANIAYGSYALLGNSTGNNNTAIGDHADVAAGNLHNATALGHNALVDANNKVRIGNNAVTSIGGKVGWTSFSDERIKNDVKENVPGLEFINALRPVTYHFSIAKENALLGVKEISAKDISLPQLKGVKMPGGKDLTMPSLTMPGMKNIAANENHEIEKIQFTGFLAQDVDNAAKSIGYDFSGIDKSGKIMGLRYSDFVVPLVKAVQELSKQNENLQKQIDELKAKIGISSKTNISLSDASIEQNLPNPFSKTTTINYTLPQKFTNAQIIITDKNGKMLKQADISCSGKGTMNVEAVSLSSGVYNYSLVVDGRIIISKQMILTK